MKQVGDEVKFRCAWGEVPRVGVVIALHHKRTWKVLRKMQVISVRGRSMRLVLVPMDTPQSEDWVRR